MTGWRITFIVAHIVQIVLIATFLKQYHFVDPALYAAVEKQQSLDVIQVAGQLGRFDLAAMFLGGIAILIGLAAIFGFAEVRSRSELRASETAGPIAARVAKKVAEAEIRPEGARLIEEWFERKGIDVDQLPKKSVSSGGQFDQNQAVADAFEDDEDGRVERN